MTIVKRKAEERFSIPGVTPAYLHSEKNLQGIDGVDRWVGKILKISRNEDPCYNGKHYGKGTRSAYFLCVVDATTILTENGPGGPGKTARPKKVYAGADMVAMGAICCPLLKLKPTDVAHIMHLDASARGQADVSKKRVAWVKLQQNS